MDERQPVVASDMEGTLSEGVTWRGMRDYLLAHGQRREMRRYLRRNLFNVLRFRWGLLPDPDQFKRQWLLGILALFEGLSREEFQEAAVWVVEHELWPQRRHDVLAELDAHADAGRRVVIASGLFEPMLTVWAKKLGFESLGTPLLFEEGHFTGRIVAGELNVGERKAAGVRALWLNDDEPLYAAYGDTAADIPLLEMAERPIAVYPDEGLRYAARLHGWRILESPDHLPE